MADRPDEHTPLIAVVTVAQPRPRPRYTHSRVRRCCTCCLGLFLLLSITASFLVLFFVPDCKQVHKHRGQICIPEHPFYRNRGKSNNSGSFGSFATSQSDDPLEYDELVKILKSTPDEKKAREWSEYYTSGPHLAGKNLSQAEWTRDRWIEFGLPQTEIVAYDVYINYPKDHRLALLQKSKKTSDPKASWKVKYEASLTEDVLEEDKTTSLEDRIPTFHGYSASGNVTGQFVFVNYGVYQDFEDLIAANVSLKGKIAIAKYGRIFRGLKVKRAQELGMIGCVIYSDPGDDGELTEENGYKAYPDGPARNPSSVQRGSVQFLSMAPGDPTTPGYPSKPGVPRLPANASTPTIPSLPISYLDAIPILKALNGHGPKASSLGEHWKAGGLGYKGVEYNVGPSPENLALNLYNKQEYVTTPLWNVIGVINGTNPNEVVILGNHRDAWIAGGSVDPNSGSAALNEVIRGFGIALSKGYKPLRTIVFGSWDGEEYGLVGSTEWVEEYIPWLNGSAVAYLNVDVGTRGAIFQASASPLLNKAIIETTKEVLSPNQTIPGQTVYDVWNKHISTMGSGSDFTAFQDFAGIPSVDIGFSEEPKHAVYHYHSNYDSFYWMDKFGDPGWHYHVTTARIWGLLAARIAESSVIPLNATDYADGLARYLAAVKDKMLNSSDAAIREAAALHASDRGPLQGLDAAISRLRNASVAFDDQALALAKDLAGDKIPWWRWWERIRLAIRVRKVNTAYKLFERQFLYSKGLDGRPWFKHVVFAPGKWTGYSGATFPGLVEAVDENNVGGLWKWGSIILALVEKARASLVLDS